MARVVTNLHVFDEGFVPDSILHRDAELTALSTALDPVRRGERPESMVLSGPTGTGKTCVVRFVVDRVQQEVDELYTAYIDCRETRTRFGVLVEALAEAGVPTFDLHSGSTPHADILNRLEDRLGGRLVVILDNVDRLQDSGLLYSLYRVPKVTLVLITNQREALFEALDTRLQSRLKSGFRIQFDAYDVDEITDILVDRTQRGLADSAVSPHQLQSVAEAVAGDAGHGIRTLRYAAETAMDNGRETIPDEVLRDAIDATEDVVWQPALDSLSSDQEVLYTLIEESEGISPGQLYEQYQATVEDPKSRRTVRKYLSALVDTNLVRKSGETRERTYHAISGGGDRVGDKTGIPEPSRR